MAFFIGQLSNRLQFADIKDAAMQGKSKGEIFHWNVYSDVATQGTTLVETTTMPETNFTISQGTMTITEAGKSIAASFFNGLKAVVMGFAVARFA